MQTLRLLEQKLAKTFRSFPKLSPRVRSVLVKIFPWVALGFGIFQLSAVWKLWQVGHRIGEFTSFSSDPSSIYGNNTVGDLTAYFWLGLFVLAIDAVILLLAYPKLVRREKVGWDLLLLASIINGLYGIITLLISGYGGIFTFAASMAGMLIGWYLLFQIRGYYSGRSSAG